eukprot:CAMPEP_0202441284 /NCGR_PEP_ID=MMETSP1360-20130828/730_1 /ASSEMBLY_ACC=CAM_ASM_000848 /TAXON_ID=515479 /ORGANISM="Licmophora paradoxa, Strain CCMP2313" /LENGTH=744 /DNA_ID=CAMNT_0049056171 /DNA_START=91 /DNA_END=2325 /DNA_ORIENTATION=-
MSEEVAEEEARKIKKNDVLENKPSVLFPFSSPNASSAASSVAAGTSSDISQIEDQDLEDKIEVDQDEDDDDEQSYIYEDSDMDQDSQLLSHHDIGDIEGDDDDSSLDAESHLDNNGDLNDYGTGTNTDTMRKRDFGSAMMNSGVVFDTGSCSVLSHTELQHNESWELLSHPTEQSSNKRQHHLQQKQQMQFSLENLEFMIKHSMNLSQNDDSLTASDMASIYSSVFTTKGTVCLGCTFQNEKTSKTCYKCGKPLLVNPFPDLKSLLSATDMRKKTNPLMAEHISKLTQIVEECRPDEEEEQGEAELFHSRTVRASGGRIAHVKKSFDFCQGILQFEIMDETQISQVNKAREQIFKLVTDFSIKQEYLKANGRCYEAELFYYLQTNNKVRTYERNLHDILQEWRVQAKSPPFIRVAKLVALQEQSQHHRDVGNVDVFMIAAIPRKATKKGTTGISLGSSERCLPMISFPLNLIANVPLMTALEAQGKHLLDEVINVFEPSKDEGKPEPVQTTPVNSIHRYLLPYAQAIKDLEGLLGAPLSFTSESKPDSVEDIKLSRDGYVLELHLRGRRLDRLPDSIQNLKHLNYLNLEDNNFSVYPQVIRCFKERALVLLSGNPLSLRDRIDNLLELQAILDLETLVGCSIPIVHHSEITTTNLGVVVSAQSNVTHVILHKRRLRTIPPSIVNLKHLQLLDLNGNEYTEFPNVLRQIDGRAYNRRGSRTMVTLHDNPLPIYTHSSLGGIQGHS